MNNNTVVTENAQVGTVETAPMQMYNCNALNPNVLVGGATLTLFSVAIIALTKAVSKNKVRVELKHKDSSIIITPYGSAEVPDPAVG